MEEEELQPISDLKIEEFREAFNVFDNNGNGRISAAELGEIFLSVGQKPSEHELQEMINEVQENEDDDEITFEQFLKMVRKRMKDVDTEEELIEAFKFFDTEGTGLINVEDLKQMMLNLGETLDPEELEEVIMEADEDNDGYVNYEEFVKTVINY
jgi:calmodulin